MMMLGPFGRVNSGAHYLRTSKDSTITASITSHLGRGRASEEQGDTRTGAQAEQRHKVQRHMNRKDRIGPQRD